MQSQGSTSSQPSFDSLSSSDSLLQSDSEQAEDDESAFRAGGSPSVIIGGGGGRGAGRGGGGRGGSSRPGGSDSPGSRTDDVYTDKEEEEDRGSEGGRPGTAAGDAQRPKSQGDLLFAKKCAELRGFVKPLLELLSGLKRGRFERGLTGFQQSVAMDRIQRIVGVLQRPSSGEKYLSTLLQVERMLRLWFPQIATANGPTASTPPPTVTVTLPIPPHKHKDQSHIPVKKRRLSWTDTESPSPSPVVVKWPRIAGADDAQKRTRQEGSSPASAPSDQLQTPQRADSDREEKGKTGRSSGPNLTQLHVGPVSSPSATCPPHQCPAASTAASTSRGGSTATQDSSVTSTTPPRHHTTDEEMPTRCQSPPATGRQTKGETVETCPRQSPPPPVMASPLSRQSPAPLET
ncbi:hypothetical protein NHX12_001927 [Muraenolepis orangiensis]|uniref:Circadian associated repressor of transcription n=1 Tax=Muraenolepis orangiensis TaxID=630683 RepID=A0A9Q0E0M3_9TELE|nr:hypothetical protein NHX12_001927 [Muraenolepis orangiensis]